MRRRLCLWTNGSNAFTQKHASLSCTSGEPSSRDLQHSRFVRAAATRNICAVKSNRCAAKRGLRSEGSEMKTITTVLLTVLAALLWISVPSVLASELVFSQSSDNQSTYGPSLVWSADNVNAEVADDFNVAANIDRVSAGGFIWGAVNFQGLHVRFYAFGADNKPGALQREYFLAAGDPNVAFDQNSGTIDATLSPAFAATGRHFLSVQPVINYWYWWSSSSGAPHGEAFYFRNNTTSEAWHHGDNLNTNINSDLVFDLYGTVTSAGVISSLSETTLPRSGFLEIFGSNFGGDGTVLIGGISAPVADWSSTRIVAYVPENAPLAALPVQVVNGGGSSNTVPLAVTTRPVAADHVNWRFRMNGPYSFVRPAIASDGTVYSVDGFSHLYAIAPDGGLKWLVRGAGDKGVAVGSDDTIYVASESFINAYNPDGSTKWQFVQNPRAFICLGVCGGTGWKYLLRRHGRRGRLSHSRLRARCAGKPRSCTIGRLLIMAKSFSARTEAITAHLLREQPSAGSATRRQLRVHYSRFVTGQPAIGPDGSIHSSHGAYSPNGNLLWFFDGRAPGATPPADIGSDGTHYFGENLFSFLPQSQWLITLACFADRLRRRSDRRSPKHKVVPG